jgi:hypothetical protein
MLVEVARSSSLSSGVQTILQDQAEQLRQQQQQQAEGLHLRQMAKQERQATLAKLLVNFNDGITGGAKYLQQGMAVLTEAPSLSFATTAMVLKHAEALQRQLE